MDNIVLNKGIIPYKVDRDNIVPFPIKRIKMKNESKSNVDLYVQRHSLQSSVGESTNDSEMRSADVESQMQPVSNVEDASVLDDTKILYINTYFDTFSIAGNKPIRLPDATYTNVHAAGISFVDEKNDEVTNQAPLTSSLHTDSIVENTPSQISSQDSSVTIDTAKVDTGKIRDAVEDAFESDGRIKVGPATVKAKTDKYIEKAEMKEIPTVGHINDEIFSSHENEVIADNAIVTDVHQESNRETPVIVPERSEIEDTKNFSVDNSENRFVVSMSNSDDKVVSDEDNYLNRLKQYEKSFKDSGNDLPEDIISFEEAKANIERAKKAAKSLDARVEEETVKLQEAKDKCSEALEGYRQVCVQVKEKIELYQQANEEKEGQISALVAERQMQEAKAAEYAHQRDEFAGLIGDNEQVTHIKRKVA